MCSLTAIVAVLMSALLVSAQAVPQGQAAPQAKTVPKAQAAKAQTAAQSCWKCPSDQGLFKFQQQAGSDPLHCQFLKDGMAYYCDYKVVRNDSPYSYHCIVYWWRLLGWRHVDLQCWWRFLPCHCNSLLNNPCDTRMRSWSKVGEYLSCRLPRFFWPGLHDEFATTLDYYTSDLWSFISTLIQHYMDLKYPHVVLLLIIKLETDYRYADLLCI